MVHDRLPTGPKRYRGVMARLKESYEAGELNEVLAAANGPTSDDVSVTTDGRRLDSATAVIAFFEEMRAGRSNSPQGG